VAGLWSIKNGVPVIEFFTGQPKRIKDAAFDIVDEIRRQTAGIVGGTYEH